MTVPVLILTIILSLLKLLVTCLPTDAVNWIMSKFKMHSEISDANAIVTFDEKRLEGEDKIQVINYFNEAKFLKKNHIFPGNEKLFLHPENSGTPIIIDTKRGKNDVRLFVYIYNDHVDVVKQHKNKVVAYSLLSESLQERSMPVIRNLV
ncbi:YfmQ family protein [Peribacillus sp. NJ4]|uniref:YfmQ family protein n=1 Tax=Peribacillus TaxID=2675229 RepID=UPI0025A12276|nr:MULTISPECIES: YfmQ family protein [unclassified Peribacillus]MDM5210883.1 YfmQ family protein [Peribacillus sp. NJ4]MDM5221189.1 YfmQ family protein [Peribacillus sp. NJ11]